MDGFDKGFILLELKYCERCGGLWLRLKGSEMVFCAQCAKAMAGVADGFTSQAAGDPPLREELCEAAFWAEGGSA